MLDFAVRIEVGERDLGELLAKVFAKEKASEDAVLHEAVYGKTTNLPIAEKTRKHPLVPPTALAFEHTAVIQPAELMGMVDAGMLGRYSDAALAGAGVGNNLLFAITSVGLGIVILGVPVYLLFRRQQQRA